MRRLLGPAGSCPERWLPFLGLAAALLVLAQAQGRELAWSIGQQAIAALLAFDGVSGAVRYSTGTAKGFFHGRGRGPVEHLAFVGLHLLHFAVVAWAFTVSGLAWFGGASFYLIVSALAVIYSPARLQRAVAAGAVALGTVYAHRYLPPIDGLEWLLPLYYLKVLLAYLVGEPAPSALPSQSTHCDDPDS